VKQDFGNAEVTLLWMFRPDVVFLLPRVSCVVIRNI
jgi:hypothetical protein